MQTASAFTGVKEAAFKIAEATALPKKTGTLFPTSLNPFHFVTWNRNQSGYPCNRAASLTVITLGYRGWMGRGAV